MPVQDLKNVDRSQLSEEEVRAIERQEDAQKKLLAQLKQERQDLVAEFDEDTDLKKKIIVSGIK